MKHSKKHLTSKPTQELLKSILKLEKIHVRVRDRPENDIQNRKGNPGKNEGIERGRIQRRAK